MNLSGDTVTDWLWAAFWSIVVFVGGVLGWMSRRQITRLDHFEGRVETLEKIIVPRMEFTDTVNGLRREIHDGNRETHSRLDKIIMMMARKRSCNENE